MRTEAGRRLSDLARAGRGCRGGRNGLGENRDASQDREKQRTDSRLRPLARLGATRERRAWRLSELGGGACGVCVCVFVCARVFRLCRRDYLHQILSEYVDFQVTTLEEMRTGKIPGP